MKRILGMGWRTALLGITVELVVVFIGVYAAFALTEHNAAREAEERRRQIQLALVREIEGITANTGNAAVVVDGMLAFYDSAFAARRTPLPQPMMEAVRVQNHMWEAALASGGLDLLDVDIIYRLSDFYNELNAGFAQLEQLRALSQSMLLPNLDRGVDEFYTRPGELREKYGWYLPLLRRLHALAERITAKGDSLVETLNESNGEARDVSEE